MSGTASVLVGLLLGASLAWYLLWRKHRTYSPSVLVAGVLALAAGWTWASHFDAYPQVFGTFSASAIAMRALWSWKERQRQNRPGSQETP